MRLGIVGISGLVGEKILESLNILDIKLDFKYDTLRVFASEITKGKVITFRDIGLVCEVFNLDDLIDFDFLILAVENDIAKKIIEYKKEKGYAVIIIDNSSEYRMDPTVPLVIPEINSATISGHDIISNPNCTTTMLCMLLAPLLTLSRIKKINVSTYQASSGAGKKGLDELLLQTKEYVIGKELTTDYWKKQYIFNVFSHNSKIGDNLYNQEEMKMINETQKILNQKFIINPTCIRVPTLTSHCLSVNVEFVDDVIMTDIMVCLSMFPGVQIEKDSPEPVLTSGKTDVYVGRIRPEIDSDGNENKKSYNFFVSGDQLLKGAAYNSVQILKVLL